MPPDLNASVVPCPYYMYATHYINKVTAHKRTVTPNSSI